jgi:hypothetical protein
VKLAYALRNEQAPSVFSGLCRITANLRCQEYRCLAKTGNNLTGSSDFVRRLSIHEMIEYSSPTGDDQFSSGQVMDKLYFGVGAALYLLFVIWCIATPQK